MTDHTADDDWLRFYGSLSAYIDVFLGRRSVLTSALFPEKPAQMWYGYEYTREATELITEWLSERVAPADYGASQRRLNAPAPGLHLVGVLWTYVFSCVGNLLDGAPASRRNEIPVLDYWRQVLDGYCGPVGWERLFDPSGTSAGQRLLGPEQVAEIVAALRPVRELDVQKVNGALTNYSWLLEAESRQGVFNHGTYPTGRGTHVLVREYGDLSGVYYSWIDTSLLGVEPGSVAVAIELDEGIAVEFDAFGMVRMAPEAYGDGVRGLAVIGEGGPLPDGEGWLRERGERVGAAHRALYRTAAGWDVRARFEAGVRSYARMWGLLVEAGGGDPDDQRRLVGEPLERILGEPLDRHVASLDTEPALWAWARREGRGTILSRLLEAAAGERTVTSA